MSDVLLEIENLETRIGAGEGAVRAVDGVSLAVRRGETFALLGESGCGKSMTALSIMRLLPAPAGHVVGGRVILEGTDLLGLSEAEMRRVRGGRIGMIFQELMTSLNPVLTIGEQIAETVHMHRRLRGRALRARVLELMDSVGVPSPRRHIGDYPHQLSGGMKQRVMIAIALAGEPQLLIADEPTTALDVTIQAEVLDLLRRLQHETGMALLLITHDLGVVAQMADQVGVMYAGHIVEEAPRAPFFENPHHPYSRKLFESVPTMDKRDRPLAVIPGSVPELTRVFHGCRFVDRCARAWEACREIAPAWRVVADGYRVRCHLYDPAHADGAPEPARVPAPAAVVRPARSDHGADLLRVTDLEIHFPIQSGLFKRISGRVRAVDGVSLAVGVGHTLALVGESGCGKTTVAKGILQLIRPTAGSVRFDGVELTTLRGRALRRRRRDFQIIFQDPFSSMNPRMMIGDIVEEGMVALGLVTDRDARRARVEELLGQVGGLPARARERYPHEFSGGQRQRICIARALAVDPKLIVCDEPTSALDVSVQAQILNLLKRLQGKLGLSYLFITHNLSVVSYLADDVAVMYLGRIVERGAVGEVLEAPCHPYTEALLSAVPVIDEASRREVIRLEGDLPTPVDPPAGCHFHPRCPRAMPVCREHYPGVTRIGEHHEVRCHLHGT
ncbi:oligopeptide transport ATP-binding protein OppD [bacterium BMS3Bbin12]|nr:oligopeptide transport ATP-binding protein OppD [bacterium BMS3Abin12]GBE47261.1 oligopeptide transport ATP-binding protein OppD [bacterium BMS3Bbin12]GBE50652.1 oligopeptide transport ATP-binding protein OppD [bacterium BMS3Bbin13]